MKSRAAMKKSAKRIRYLERKTGSRLLNLRRQHNARFSGGANPQEDGGGTAETPVVVKDLFNKYVDMDFTSVEAEEDYSSKLSRIIEEFKTLQRNLQETQLKTLTKEKTEEYLTLSKVAFSKDQDLLNQITWVLEGGTKVRDYVFREAFSRLSDEYTRKGNLLNTYNAEDKKRIKKQDELREVIVLCIGMGATITRDLLPKLFLNIRIQLEHNGEQLWDKDTNFLVFVLLGLLKDGDTVNKVNNELSPELVTAVISPYKTYKDKIPEDKIHKDKIYKELKPKLLLLLKLGGIKVPEMILRGPEAKKMINDRHQRTLGRSGVGPVLADVAEEMGAVFGIQEILESNVEDTKKEKLLSESVKNDAVRNRVLAMIFMNSLAKKKL